MVVSENVQSVLEDVSQHSMAEANQSVMVLLIRPEKDTDRPCDVYTYVRYTSEIGIHATPIQVSTWRTDL